MVVANTFKFNPSATVWEVSGDRIYAKSGEIVKQVTYYNGDDGNERPETIFRNEIFLYANGVPDIYERFAKALNHLATFCEKKKETF